MIEQYYPTYSTELKEKIKICPSCFEKIRKCNYELKHCFMYRCLGCQKTFYIKKEK